MKTSPTEGPIVETPTGVLRRQLAAAANRHPVNQVHVDEATLGERMADKAARGDRHLRLPDRPGRPCGRRHLGLAPAAD